MTICGEGELRHKDKVYSLGAGMAFIHKVSDSDTEYYFIGDVPWHFIYIEMLHIDPYVDALQVPCTQVANGPLLLDTLRQLMQGKPQLSAVEGTNLIYTLLNLFTQPSLESAGELYHLDKDELEKKPIKTGLSISLRCGPRVYNSGYDQFVS